MNRETMSAASRRPNLQRQLDNALAELRKIDGELRTAARGTPALQLQRKRSSLARSIKALRNAIGRAEEQKRIAGRHREVLDRFDP